MYVLCYYVYCAVVLCQYCSTMSVLWHCVSTVILCQYRGTVSVLCQYCSTVSVLWYCVSTVSVLCQYCVSTVVLCQYCVSTVVLCQYCVSTVSGGSSRSPPEPRCSQSSHHRLSGAEQWNHFIGPGVLISMFGI